MCLFAALALHDYDTCLVYRSYCSTLLHCTSAALGYVGVTNSSPQRHIHCSRASMHQRKGHPQIVQSCERQGERESNDNDI
jgi:hypothetical protein